MKYLSRRAAAFAALAGAAALVATPAQAALVVTSAGQTLSESFDSLGSTAATNLAWANNSTLAGWSLFRQPGPGTALTSYRASNGGDNTGAFYSFGSTAGERALGGVGSGGTYFGSPANPAVAGWMAVALTNLSGLTLDGFSATWRGEQWRNGGNTAAHTMVFEWGIGSSFTTVGAWNAPGGLFNFASVVNTATAAAVDGNSAGLVAGRGGSISTAWNPGDTLWLRWIENNETGSDHGLAIDDFSFTAGAEVPAPIPLPLPALLMATGLAAYGWAGRRRKA